MDRQDASMIAGFERGLAAIPEIRHPERLLSDPTTWSGPPPPDLACDQALREEKLATCPACSGHLNDRDETHPRRPALPAPGRGRHPPQGLATQIIQISAAAGRPGGPDGTAVQLGGSTRAGHGKELIT
jgi:hypothetical protein